MASLQKFKFLATQCSVAAAGRSPARSPAKSPVVHLRRRKTLRMLLNRAAASGRRRPSDFGETAVDSTRSEGDCREKKKEIRARRKLKELFVSSPSPPLEDRLEILDERRGTSPAAIGSFNGNRPQETGTSGSLRPVSAAFRYRIFRRHWRPVLVTIPEQ